MTDLVILIKIEKFDLLQEYLKTEGITVVESSVKQSTCICNVTTTRSYSPQKWLDIGYKIACINEK